MILFRRMGTKLNPSAKYYFPIKNYMPATILTLDSFYKHSSSKLFVPLISTPFDKKVDWNLHLIGTQQCKIQCLIILNNQDFNKMWLQKVLTQASNVILADGGANILFNEILQQGQKSLQLVKKVNVIIGDLDSIKTQTKQFFQSHSIPLIKQHNQDINDYEKALTHGVNLGYRNFVVSGAFGDRLDHTLSAMSITQKFTKQNSNLYIILSSKQSIFCPLRPKYTHKIHISDDMSKKSSAIVAFQKVNHIETKGFKWNLGPQQKHSSIEFGSFLSTSNQIVDQNVEVYHHGNTQALAYFIGRFKKQSK